MRNKIIVVLAVAGVVFGLFSAYIYGVRKKPLPPAFNPAQNPYAHGIFATGIVESFQSNGANINIFPEVAGTITQILVREGELTSRDFMVINCIKQMRQNEEDIYILRRAYCSGFAP